MAPHHNSDLCACFLGGRGGVGVKDDAEGMFGVLGVGDGFGDEVAEAFDGKEVGCAEVEIYDEDRDGGDGRKRGGWRGGREDGGEDWGGEGRD